MCATLLCLTNISDLYDDIFRQGLESLSIGLHDRNGNMTRLPGLDVSDDAGLTCMRAADDLALNAVS